MGYEESDAILFEYFGFLLVSNEDVTVLILDPRVTLLTDRTGEAF